MTWGALRCGAASALAVVGVVLSPSAASAYTMPSGVTSAPTFCPARPADVLSTTAGPAFAIGPAGTAVSSTTGVWTDVSSTAPTAGPATIGVEFNFVANGFVRVRVRDSTGAFQEVAFAQVNSQKFVSLQVPMIGAGTVSVGFEEASASAGTMTVGGIASGSTDSNYLQQEASDVCARDEALWAQQHTDETTLHTDLGTTAPLDQDVRGIKGLGSSTKTLFDLWNAAQSIDADTAPISSAVVNTEGAVGARNTLHDLYTELVVLDSDIKASSGSSGTGGTTGTAQPVSVVGGSLDHVNGQVQLSSADRQLEADIGTQNDGDLWVIVGALIGLYAFSEVLRRIFPVGGRGH